MQWGDRWQRDDPPPTRFVDSATAPPPTRFVDSATDAPVDPVLVDRATHRPIAELKLRAVGKIAAGIRRTSD